MIPVYTRVFSPEQYGIIDLIATITSFLSILFIAGLDSGIARYYIDADSEQDKRVTASTGMLYVLAVSFVIIIALLPFSGQLSKLIFGSDEYWQFLLAGLVAIPFTLLNAMFLNLLRFRLQPVVAALLSVGLLLAQTALTIILVVFLHKGIIGVYLAAIVANFLFCILGFWLTRSSYSAVFSSQRLRQLLHFGLPYLPLSFSFYIMTYANRYFLRYYAGLDEVGLYGVAYRLASVIGILTVGFQLAWGPFVMSTYKDEDAKITFARAFDYASIVICLAVLFISLFSRELLRFFTTETYINAYKVVPLIATSIVTYTLGAYFAVGIGLTKKTIHLAWTSAVMALINIVLNVILIPRFGMVGAALSTTISFLLLAVMVMMVSQRLYFVPFRFYSNLAMYFVTALIIFVAYLFIMNEITWTNIIIKVLLLAGFLAVPFLLRLIGKPEIEYIRGSIAKITRMSKTD